MDFCTSEISSNPPPVLHLHFITQGTLLLPLKSVTRTLKRPPETVKEEMKKLNAETAESKDKSQKAKQDRKENKANQVRMAKMVT